VGIECCHPATEEGAQQKAIGGFEEEATEGLKYRIHRNSEPTEAIKIAETTLRMAAWEM
jgi:20S proteasome alpha/beta subunit